MPGAAVRIERVVARYPGSDRNAVDDVSLDVAAGELVVLLGPSRLRQEHAVAHDQPARRFRTSGRIVVDGADVRDACARSAAPQHRVRDPSGRALPAHDDRRATSASCRELLGWDRARIAARVDELLALVRLEPARYRDRLPRELSGGEQQRAASHERSRREPRVLLMDEPFGAVDAIVRASLQDETLRIHAALGTTIFFVTHDVDEALRIADRIVVMEAGESFKPTRRCGCSRDPRLRTSNDCSTRTMPCDACNSCASATRCVAEPRVRRKARSMPVERCAKRSRRFSKARTGST